MVKVARTLRELRDVVIARLGAEKSEDYETLVINMVNDAITFITSAYSWDFLTKRTTVTVTSPLTYLPSDCDRIQSLYKDGDNYLLRKLPPAKFAMVKGDDNETETKYFAILDYTSDADGTYRYGIDFHAFPEIGSVYNLVYTHWMNELEVETLDSNIPLPPHIVDLVMRKVMLDALRHTESQQSAIRAEESAFLFTLEQYKKKEDSMTSKYDDIPLHPAIREYNRTKGMKGRRG